MFGRKKAKVTFDEMPTQPISERHPISDSYRDKKEAERFDEFIRKTAPGILEALIQRNGALGSDADNAIEKAVDMAAKLDSTIKRKKVLLEQSLDFKRRIETERNNFINNLKNQ